MENTEFQEKKDEILASISEHSKELLNFNVVYYEKDYPRYKHYCLEFISICAYNFISFHFLAYLREKFKDYALFVEMCHTTNKVKINLTKNIFYGKDRS